MAVWEAFENQGVSGEVVKVEVLKNMYANARAYIRLDRVGEEFEVQRGVKQEDPLSPNLINAVPEEIFQKLDWDGRG